MDVSATPAAERIARVLAGERLSVNAQGSEESAGRDVDNSYKDHLGEALAVLKTLREPSEKMAAAGDPAIWERMILVAIDEAKPTTVVL